MYFDKTAPPHTSSNCILCTFTGRGFLGKRKGKDRHLLCILRRDSSKKYQCVLPRPGKILFIEAFRLEKTFKIITWVQPQTQHCYIHHWARSLSTVPNLLMGVWSLSKRLGQITFILTVFGWNDKKFLDQTEAQQVASAAWFSFQMNWFLGAELLGYNSPESHSASQQMYTLLWKAKES